MNPIIRPLLAGVPLAADDRFRVVVTAGVLRQAAAEITRLEAELGKLMSAQLSRSTEMRGADAETAAKPSLPGCPKCGYRHPPDGVCL